jgi:hypothetical protein
LALSRWLVRRYPPPWRERYEDEMLALLDESAPRWRDITDLVRGLAVERARATFEPGDRPWLTYALVAAAQQALGVGFVFIASVVGWGARYWLGDPPQTLGRADDLIVIACLFAFCVRSFQLALESQRYQLTGNTDLSRYWLPLFSRRTGAVWLATIFIGVFLSTWESSYANLTTHLMLGTFASYQLASWRLIHNLSEAVHQLGAAKHELKWALMERDRCERLAAEGAMSPLQEARSNVERITHRMGEARTMLHAMGYRAKYR